MQQLAPRASMEAEPRIVLALRRAKRSVSHRGKPRFTHIFVLPAERIARTVPWPGAAASLSDSALVSGLWPMSIGRLSGGIWTRPTLVPKRCNLSQR